MPSIGNLTQMVLNHKLDKSHLHHDPIDLSSVVQCDITQNLICKVNVINLGQKRTVSQLLLPVLSIEKN